MRSPGDPIPMRGDPHEAIARARELLPKPIKYETIKLPEWGAADVDLADVALLPGRVIVRVKADHHSSLLWLPTVRAQGLSLGLGEVVAMGPPAKTRKGALISHHFAVGDIVLHQSQHASRDVPLRTETYRAISQAEVWAVVESGTVTDTHDPRHLSDVAP
jgi:co-chaperonin GroES (HSP10)